MYHVLNRANASATLFATPEDYDAFDGVKVGFILRSVPVSPPGLTRLPRSNAADGLRSLGWRATIVAYCNKIRQIVEEDAAQHQLAYHGYMRFELPHALAILFVRHDHGPAGSQGSGTSARSV